MASLNVLQENCVLSLCFQWIHYSYSLSGLLRPLTLSILCSMCLHLALLPSKSIALLTMGVTWAQPFVYAPSQCQISKLLPNVRGWWWAGAAKDRRGDNLKSNSRRRDRRRSPAGPTIVMNLTTGLLSFLTEPCLISLPRLISPPFSRAFLSILSEPETPVHCPPGSQSTSLSHREIQFSL